MRLRRRISTGSIPIFKAARSTSPSVTEQAIGWPTPRYWHITFLEHDPGPSAIIPGGVLSADQVDDLIRFDGAGARIHRIGTDAGEIVDLECSNRPVTLDADPPPAAMVAGVNVGVEAFDAFGDIFDRPPQ